MSVLFFEINNRNYTTYEVNGTTVYEIEDFYKYPDKVVDFIFNLKPDYHKGEQLGEYSLNGRKFRDRRHEAEVQGLHLVTEFLSELCGQRPLHSPNRLLTNYFDMLDPEFDLYQDNYWWPHIDDGYTSLIYLNKFSYPGTNMYQHKIYNSPEDYRKIEVRVWLRANEHLEPWQPKSDWKLNYTIQAEYNKLVLFDGFTNVHSMNVDSSIFQSQTRLNQALFFAPYD
jgi:hypothetical protein